MIPRFRAALVCILLLGASTASPRPLPADHPLPKEVGSLQGTGQFSAPAAAHYSENDSRVRGFPRVIDTGFTGNGHAETWDGRVFVRTRTDGWYASAFRPERIVRTADAAVDFQQGAFGQSLLLESNSAAPGFHHNWLAIVPDPAVRGENPFPSDATGAPSATGTHLTYGAVVFHTALANDDNDQMGVRTARFVVSNPRSRDAQVVRAEFTSSFRVLRLQGGADFRCIEPSATLDGRLIVCQGDPSVPGRIDNLVYSWNPTPAGVTGWRPVKSMANMHWDDRNVDVAGLPFMTRYPLAARPLLDATGNDYNRNELVKGAYPWISHDGTELFFQASREGVPARRTGTSVVGRWTGWAVRHIDGPINPYRHVDTRLFLSSPGAFTTMWTPYKDVDDLKIPYSLRGPGYPLFGSNSHDYMEVGFDDYLDGNYVLHLGMNEQLNRDGAYQVTRTSDTSGRLNNGTLVGAKFPLEHNGRDEIVGRYGQAIYFSQNSYVEVAKNAGWDTLGEGVTVDFWVKVLESSGTVRLFTLQGGLLVYLTQGNRLTAALIDGANVRVELAGPAITAGQWVHVAMRFDSADRSLQLYVDGSRVATRVVSGFGALRTTGAVRVGPDASSALLLMDEVKVSNVARSPTEIGHNANVVTHQAPDPDLVAAIPAHLRPLRFAASGVDRFSPAAAELGRSLFEDVILSRQRTTSCATCHRPGQAFTDGRAISRGNEPTDAGVRNSPTLLNRLFSSLQGWSGQAMSLDRQALIPIAAAHELNLPINQAVQRLVAHHGYAARFQAVYGQAPSAETLAAALGSFQAIQFAPANRVDAYRGGDRARLTASEVRGLDLFEGKARCSGCHAGQNYTDESFRNNGLTTDADPGRAEITGRNRDFRLFKVPTLRELASTAPYMHDGSLATLLEVVASYNEGGLGDPMADSDIRPLELSNEEMRDLEAFLKALSGAPAPAFKDGFEAR